MPGEIYAGVRPRGPSAREPPQTLAWLALTMAAAGAAGAMLGRGEVKLGILPVAALLVLFLAAVPVAGYVAILWSVGTFVDMLAPPAVTISWLGFVPAEILLWIALGSLVFLPRDVRRGLRALARRRESVVMALFLAAVVGGVAVGVENGASLHAAVFDMRLMLFYAAFWPALAALASGRELVFKLVSRGCRGRRDPADPPGDRRAIDAPVRDRPVGRRLLPDAMRTGSCGCAHPGSRRSTSSLRSPSPAFSGDRLGIGWSAGRWRRWRSPA